MNQRTPLYLAGALMLALSAFGLYYATRKTEVAGIPQDASPAVPAVGVDAPQPAVVPVPDDNLTLLDGQAAGITLASNSGGECWLEYLEQAGKPVSGDTLSDGLQTQFYGWGLAGAGKDVTAMLIEFKPLEAAGVGGFVRLNAGVQRDDIAKAKASDAYRNAGFHKAGLLQGVQKGKYHLYLVMQADHSLTQCDLNRDVRVQ